MSKPVTTAALSVAAKDGLTLTVSTYGTHTAPSTTCRSWALAWGDGLQWSGDGTPPPIAQYAYEVEGDKVVTLTILDSHGHGARTTMPVTVFHSVIVPPTSSLYGPQSTITCPVGAVSIPVGSTTASRATLITANPGATFCLAAGVHTASGNNTPTSGQTFVGQYGAIIDGTGWAFSSPDDAVFQANNNNVDTVTIRNIVFRNLPAKAILCYNTSDHWTIEYNEIHHCLTGLEFGPYTTLRHNYIHHNGNPGDPGNPDPSLRGGGYVSRPADYSVISYNEIAYNGVEQKVGESVGVEFRNNWYHHNLGNGIWYDYCAPANGIVDGNLLEDNGNAGIDFEGSNGCTITNNIGRRNADSGLYITVSQNVDASYNTFQDNLWDMQYFVDLASVDATHDLQNNYLHHNTIRVRSGGHGAAFSVTGAGDQTPYTNNTKNNNFDYNTYTVLNLSDNDWLWTSFRNWTSWQGLPQDVNGTHTL